MQATVISSNKNNKNDIFFINNGNFSSDYFGNSNIKIINANNIEILYIFLLSTVIVLQILVL